MGAAPPTPSPATPSPPPGPRPLGFHGAVSEFKRRLIEATLTQTGGTARGRPGRSGSSGPISCGSCASSRCASRRRLVRGAAPPKPMEAAMGPAMAPAGRMPATAVGRSHHCKDIDTCERAV